MAARTPYIASDAKIYVAGHRGMVGGAIARRVQSLGYKTLLTRAHADLDLTDQTAVNAFVKICGTGVSRRVSF